MKEAGIEHVQTRVTVTMSASGLQEKNGGEKTIGKSFEDPKATHDTRLASRLLFKSPSLESELTRPGE